MRILRSKERIWQQTRSAWQTAGQTLLLTDDRLPADTPAGTFGSHTAGHPVGLPTDVVECPVAGRRGWCAGAHLVADPQLPADLFYYLANQSIKYQPGVM